MTNYSTAQRTQHAEVLAVLAGDEWWPIAAIKARVTCSGRFVRYRLQELARDGLVEWRDGDGTTEWRRRLETDVTDRPGATEVRGSKLAEEAGPTSASTTSLQRGSTEAGSVGHSCSGTDYHGQCSCEHSHCLPHQHDCNSWCDYDGREGF